MKPRVLVWEGPLPPSFWARVEKTKTCWLWTGGRSTGGYGYYYAPTHDRRLAHRVAYESLVGPIPAGLQIDHLCRNRACVNPEHLEPVTQQENLLRGALARRPREHPDDCPYGHRMTGENLILTPWRACRECVLARQRAYNRKRGRVADSAEQVSA